MESSKRVIFTNNFLSDSSIQAVFGRSYDRIAYLKIIGEIEGQLTICKEPFMKIPIVMYTKKNFYLIPELNKNLELLKQSGLINFWRQTVFDKGTLKTSNQKAPKIIKLNHITGSLQILLIGFVSSLVVFIVELKFHRLM